jgi:hypothetical protein
MSMALEGSIKHLEDRLDVILEKATQRPRGGGGSTGKATLRGDKQRTGLLKELEFLFPKYREKEIIAAIKKSSGTPAEDLAAIKNQEKTLFLAGPRPQCNNACPHKRSTRDSAKKKRMAVLMRGESFRDTRKQGERQTCSSQGVEKQLALWNSHMQAFSKIEGMGYEIEMFAMTKPCAPKSGAAPLASAALLSRWYKKYLKMPIAVEEDDSVLDIETQGHGPVLDVLLMHHFNKIVLNTTSTERYNVGLLMRWDELTNADNWKPCLLEQAFGLNGRDLHMGSDQDLAQIIPGADLTCWVSTV